MINESLSSIVPDSKGSCTIRRARREDIPSIVDLIWKVFGHGPSIEEFEAVHFMNPAGKSILYVAENSGGSIVSYRGLLRAVVLHRGVHFDAAQGSQAATHPDYRRQGLISRMSRSMNQHFFEEGGDLIISFPAPATARIFVRDLGYRHIGDLRHAVFPIASMSKSERLFLRPGISLHNLLFYRDHSAVVTPVRNAVLLENRPHASRARFDRAKATQNWLFGGRQRQYHALRVPGVDGVVVLGSIIRRGRKACTVVELQCEDPKQSSRLLQAVPRWAAGQGYQLVFTWLGRQRSAYLQAGYVPMPSTVPFLLLPRDDLNIPELTSGVRAWDLSLLDTDAY